MSMNFAIFKPNKLNTSLKQHRDIILAANIRGRYYILLLSARIYTAKSICDNFAVYSRDGKSPERDDGKMHYLFA